MAFTVIPIKDYEELIGGVLEADSSKVAFNYSEMEKNSDTYRQILSYMKTTNVKKIGTGTSRTAFFLPPGSVKEDSSIPSCFKVAKNKKGVKQNDEEIKMFNEFGKNRACFPELFEWDEANSYFMQTEVGRPLKDKELISFFEDWNQYVLDMKMSPGSRHAPYYLMGLNAEEPSLRANYEYTEKIYKCIEALNDKDSTMRWADDPDYIISNMEDISDEFPKYKPLTELMRFSVEGGWNKGMMEDLKYNEKNWAMICRNGEKCLVPIDYGFTWEARSLYENQLRRELKT